MQDLWIPYFNITTDITASAMRVHTDGKVSGHYGMCWLLCGCTGHYGMWPSALQALCGATSVLACRYQATCLLSATPKTATC